MEVLGPLGQALLLDQDIAAELLSGTSSPNPLLLHRSCLALQETGAPEFLYSRRTAAKTPLESAFTIAARPDLDAINTSSFGLVRTTISTKTTGTLE